MRHFLRALRFTWPYRRRIFASLVCALIVALLWGANFTAIYPVLKVLTRDTNLQTWVDAEIRQKELEIERLLELIERRSRELQRVESLPPSRSRERRLAELTHDLAKDEAHLAQARWMLGWFQTLRIYIYKFCPEDRFDTLVSLLALVVLGIGIKGFFDFAQEALVGSVVHLALLDLRNRLYDNVLRLDVTQFSTDGTHELMARFTNDMELLGNGLKTLFGKLIAEPLKALSCILFACFISWRLTLVFLILVPIAVFTMSKVGSYMKRAGRKMLESMSQVYKVLQETFLAIKVVKAFTMEAHKRLDLYKASRDYYRRGMRLVIIEALSGPAMEWLAVLAVAGALVGGSYLVLRQQTHIWGLRMTAEPLEPESLLALYALLAAIADPVRKLSSVYNKLQSGAAAADRIFYYMDRQPRVVSPFPGRILKEHRRDLVFRDICFSYHPGRPVLTNISLDIRFGEVIAIVGRNGSGKSTLVGLLPRFYDPDHGSILIDGIDHREFTLRSLRRQIGFVGQEIVLFDDTIRNNITAGLRHVPQELVEEAARRAYAHDFIMQLKDGYDTRIGELGHTLSGGQRQRIALARAILRNPSILILDEFTSASDPESEMLLHKALRDFVRHRTTIIISHRLSTLELADRIVVLEKGRVEAIGTHAELLQQCPLYQRLFERQAHRHVA
ncbi:MAG: ABC transporter ATP-binding protein [Gemmatales bacterium]|nr:ABC transporter ATP-binding protein/permease [Gemmatales bacterium]MDW7993450.1 ABC transporter ATP-binding protein [Gemmatales bacterium]